MLNLERLGNLTTELSTNLIRSIVLPGGLRGWRPRWNAAPQQRPREPVAAVPPGPTGSLFFVSGERVPEDAVVAALHRAGGRQGSAVVLAVGEESQAGAAQAARSFSRYGVPQTEIIEILSRGDADKPIWDAHLQNAQILILYAARAQQARNLLLGTACHTAAQAFYSRGGVVIGLQAAAPALATHYLRSGGSAAPVVERGLGLLPPTILPVDPKLREQGPGWLLGTLGAHLDHRLLGLHAEVGAVLLFEGEEVRLLGEGAVSLLDGSEVTPEPPEVLSRPTEVPVAPDAHPVLGLKVHILIPGYGFNLRTRRPLGPPRPPLQAAQGQ